MNPIVCMTALCVYLIGAFPVGYIVARLKGISDIREHGSGNIGATNVSRVLGMPYFFLIFFLDAGKAFLALRLIKPYFPLEYLYFFALVLLLGNSCSVFLRGKGGKGVSTLCGLLAALHVQLLFFVLVIWSICMIVFKTVGIASILAALSLPLYAYISCDKVSFFFSLIACLWVVWLHRSNIRMYWQVYSAPK